jgi:hypothetical protein
MEETTGSDRGLVNELGDALRYLGDASYAILPKEVAHNLGDLKKSFLSTIRTLIDKDIEWVEARVAGGDRVREEWQQKCRDKADAASSEPINEM